MKAYARVNRDFLDVVMDGENFGYRWRINIRLFVFCLFRGYSKW